MGVDMFSMGFGCVTSHRMKSRDGSVQGGQVGVWLLVRRLSRLNKPDDGWIRNARLCAGIAGIRNQPFWVMQGLLFA